MVIATNIWIKIDVEMLSLPHVDFTFVHYELKELLYSMLAIRVQTYTDMSSSVLLRSRLTIKEITVYKNIHVWIVILNLIKHFFLWKIYLITFSLYMSFIIFNRFKRKKNFGRLLYLRQPTYLQYWKIFLLKRWFSSI